MAIMTLRRYLTGPEETAGYRRVIDTLLEGMAHTAVRADETDYTAFQEDMKRIAETAPEGCPLDQLLVATGAAVQAMDGYNARTSRLVRQQNAEFQNMISMLTQTVVSISGGSDRANEALTEVQKGLESASALSDVHRMKARLGECLRVVREEAARQKAETQAAVAELQGHIGRAQRTALSAGDDPATGLPNRKAAEEAIQQSLLVPGRKYLVTAVMDRLQSINARFGSEMGDRVLRVLRDRLREHLKGTDMLFRWNGPTLVAVMWREESLEQMRRIVRHIFETPFEKEFDIGGRNLLIPISAGWSVVGMIPPASTLLNYVDRFVANQSPRDYC